MTPVKRNLLLPLTCSLLIFLFVYTSLSKLQEFKGFSYALSKFPVLGSYSSILALTLPLTELFAATLLFFPATRLAGLYCSFVLMTAFTLYVGYLVLLAPHLPCLCGGVIQQMNWGQHLLFNLLITSLTVMGIRIQKHYTKNSSTANWKLAGNT